MTVPTPPAVSEAMREAVARKLAELADWHPDCIYEPRQMEKVCLAIPGEPIWVAFCEDADALIAGPLASEIARLTGERDAAVKLAEAAERNLIARIRTDEAETGRLRAFVQHCEREVYPLVRDSWALNRSQANAFIDALNEARAALSSQEKTDG